MIRNKILIPGPEPRQAGLNLFKSNTEQEFVENIFGIALHKNKYYFLLTYPKVHFYNINDDHEAFLCTARFINNNISLSYTQSPGKHRFVDGVRL